MRIHSVLGFASMLVGASIVGCASEAGAPAVGENAGQGSSAVVDCDALRNEVNDLTPQVEACNPAGSLVQCRIALDGICCPITANGGPIEKYKDAVAKFKASCTAICPAVLCHEPPSGVCLLSGSCQE